MSYDVQQQANVNVTANLLLNVYGIRAINVTLDLCNILGGALCPLPMYNFIGSDSISLPESLGVQDKIPGIVFKIPDLEGVAQLVLTEVGTGNVKACVQATLSNGWSTHQTSVEWVTGGMALATLISSIWQSLSPAAVLPFRLIDLLFLYQTIASTSFLSLNYPSTYRAFTLNFAWAMGLFSTPPTSSLQPSIDRMRHLTGGNLANATSTSAVSLVNRKLSPYNFGEQVISALVRRVEDTLDLSATTKLFLSGNTAARSSVAIPSATQGGDVQTVTTSSSNILQAGIPIYALFFFLPITVFTFYQWTLKDSWLSTFLSVISLLTLFVAAFYPASLLLRRVRISGSRTLYEDNENLASNGPLYAQYRAPRFYFFVPLILSSLLKAIFVAFGKGSGETQIILMVILEGFTVIAHLVLRPYPTRGGDIFSTFLAIIRLVCNGLMISFIERLNVAPIPRVAIGLVIAVIFSVAVLVTYVNIIIHCGIERLWKRGSSGASAGSGSTNASMLEKGPRILGSSSQSSELIRRPSNPTPNSSDHLDPHYLHPFPVSPTETEVNSVHTSNRTSGTMTSVQDYDLVRIYHPDKVDPSVSPESAHARFQLITFAYDALRGKTPVDDSATPKAPAQDFRHPTTAARSRHHELYAGKDDRWKDRVILAGVVATVGILVAQIFSTRRQAMAEAAARSRHLDDQRRQRAPIAVSSLAEHDPDRRLIGTE
ncbi:hypothetical protein H0H81_002344 [Sphagnurus paluster]|uniref:ML-like domain-containing protein n=1 Tax=Sphagnurus paluster TaxID=117069 RepID=A0A9P7FX68_9AGAR|nr:hypothetical protein H0H81_002344 [Sphagnurus paluster]